MKNKIEILIDLSETALMVLKTHEEDYVFEDSESFVNRFAVAIKEVRECYSVVGKLDK